MNLGSSINVFIEHVTIVADSEPLKIKRIAAGAENNSSGEPPSKIMTTITVPRAAIKPTMVVISMLCS
jgi:hypothetical protein